MCLFFYVVVVVVALVIVVIVVLFVVVLLLMFLLLLLLLLSIRNFYYFLGYLLNVESEDDGYLDVDMPTSEEFLEDTGLKNKKLRNSPEGDIDEETRQK